MNMKPHHAMLLSYLVGLLFAWPSLISLFFIQLFVTLFYNFGFISGNENDRRIRRAMLSEEGREQIRELNEKHEHLFKERIAPTLLIFNVLLIWAVQALLDT